jgi:hypothetical protein
MAAAHMSISDRIIDFFTKNKDTKKLILIGETHTTAPGLEDLNDILIENVGKQIHIITNVKKLDPTFHTVYHELASDIPPTLTTKFTAHYIQKYLEKTKLADLILSTITHKNRTAYGSCDHLYSEDILKLFEENNTIVAILGLRHIPSVCIDTKDIAVLRINGTTKLSTELMITLHPDSKEYIDRYLPYIEDSESMEVGSTFAPSILAASLLAARSGGGKKRTYKKKNRIQSRKYKSRK